ncbi:MAG: GTP pyrophosphokinase [Dysgonamonadaceae bacterium]|nr:GTP pyrophosphokinase [Dysgonamonadaceae bacterium]MDD4728282.1 GTP pyrophosphokinase [Dysgonamonadaceae bacterium]
MNLEEQLRKAIFIAINAHEKQLDINGQPYICHPFRVMEAGQTIEEKIVGVLHDLIEDTPLTLTDLSAEGFSEEIIDAVHALSKLENEDYDHYIGRIKRNNLAVRVKLNDLTDNMDLRRLKELSKGDIERMQKYLKAYNELTNK